jgi:hypothetical protein
MRLRVRAPGYLGRMREDEELTEQARRSREETQELREEGLRADDDEPESPPPAAGGEPRAKTSSCDAEHLTSDDDD